MDTQGGSGRPLPGCVGTLYAALWVGVMLCVHHSFGRVGPPYNEEMKTMEKLTLTLHKTKDTKNKVVYGAGHAPGCHIRTVSPGRPPWLGNRAEEPRR